MVIKPLDRKIWRELRQMKGQLLTLSFVVGTGIALFFASWSAYQSLQVTQDRYYAESRFADIFVHLKRAPLDILPKIARIPDVLQTEARLAYLGIIEVPQQIEPAVAQVLSYPIQGDASLNAVFIYRGQAPRAKKDILVHQAFAKAHHLRVGDRLDVLLYGQRRSFQVCGIGTSAEFVYALNPISPLPDDKHFGVFWVSYDSMEEILGMSGAFNDLLVSVDSSANLASIKAEVDAFLYPFGALRAVGRDQQLSASLIADEIRQQKALAVFMPIIFLTVSAFILNIIISRYVALQRTQIGALKALGYRDREVTFHYLKFVLAIILISSLPGIGLGYYLGYLEMQLYAKFFSFPSMLYQPQLQSVVMSLLASVLCGVLGGTVSILRVLRLSPVEAMRPPVPEMFRKKLNWLLHAKVDQRFKMSLRSLFHRPLRALMTIIGIALGLSLMVMARGWSDVFDYLIQGQFSYVQRENMSLSFIRPQPISVLNELQKIPGVLANEGLRELPIYLKFKNHAKNTLLLGINKNAQMRLLTNKNFQKIPIGENGLILSRRFQSSWAIKAGDWVELDRLDGVPGSLRLPVLGFVDDLLGQGAYIEIHQLWSLLAEEPTFSSVNMRVDSTKMNQIYQHLRKMPQVASVGVKSVFLQGFKEAIGNMIASYVMILTGFAVFMIIGVVYNAVRISFAERSWEFAGLRVLGFYSSEVFMVLALEFFISVALAIMPGLIFGYFLTSFSLSLIHTESFSFPMMIYPPSYGLAVIVLMFSFGLSLFVAYFMVKKLKIVEALKARE